MANMASSFMLVMVVLASAASSTLATFAAVKGTVTCQNGGDPVPGLEVSLSCSIKSDPNFIATKKNKIYTAITNGNGKYAFDFVAGTVDGFRKDFDECTVTAADVPVTVETKSGSTKLKQFQTYTTDIVLAPGEGPCPNPSPPPSPPPPPPPPVCPVVVPSPAYCNSGFTILPTQASNSRNGATTFTFSAKLGGNSPVDTVLVIQLPPGSKLLSNTCDYSKSNKYPTSRRLLWACKSLCYDDGTGTVVINLGPIAPRSNLAYEVKLKVGSKNSISTPSGVLYSSCGSKNF